MEKYTRLLKREFENAFFRVSIIILKLCDSCMGEFHGLLIL